MPIEAVSEADLDRLEQSQIPEETKKLDHLVPESGRRRLIAEAGVRKCPKKSTRAWGLFGALEMNAKIFLLYYQMFIS
jgi:hypothetical protein